MRCPFLPFQIAILVLGAIACRAENFIFAPRDGDHYTVKSHREILTEASGQANEIDVSDDSAEETVHVTGATVHVTRTLKSQSQNLDGTPVQNPATALLIDHPLTRVFDRKGQLLRIEGNEQILIAAKLLPGENLREAAEAEFKSSTLDATEASAWRVAGCGWLPGHPARQDAQWEEEEPEPFSVNGRPARLHAIVRVAGVQYDGDHLAATVLMFASTDPALLKDVRALSVRDLDNAAVQDFIEWNVGDLPLHKVISRVVVDPRTLEITERERIDIGVDGTADALRTRIEHDTMKYAK